jgi:aminopeptidase N
VSDTLVVKGQTPAHQPETPYYNAKENFDRSDTLRGKLTPLRSCYDVTFYHLDIEVDMDKRSIKGSNLMRFDVKQPFQVMQVDLYGNMKIGEIMFKGRPLKYTREFDAVFIQFPEILRDQQAEILIHYEGVPKVPDWSIPMNGGVLWDKDDKGNPWAQVVCQGSGASLWWPNKDHLSDEPDSMKIWITVPSGYSEVSNGRLIRKVTLPENKTRYEWAVSYPINNYNATFNIGKYVHYRDYYVTDDSLTLDYYVMDYNLETARQMFKQVKPMLACYEKYFGKYPFGRDGFTLVESIYPMEHQSGVCIGKITPQHATAHNPLLWHEAAHEWWGNAISCTDMADMWFHEAFATYAESLVIECELGQAHASEFLNEQRTGINNRYPLIGVRDVNHIYYDIGGMYGKGSLVLHTFRSVLNDDAVWFGLLRAIQEEFRYTTLTSDELVAFINQQTKTDYTYFFDQYLEHTSLPALELKLKQHGSDLLVHYRWRADVNNFAMPVKVTTGPDVFDFIHPRPDWQQMTISNFDLAEFEVDEDGFLIDVAEVVE